MSDSSNEPEIRGELTKKIGKVWRPFLIAGSVISLIPAVFFMWDSYSLWFADYSDYRQDQLFWPMLFYAMYHFAVLPFLVVPLITLIIFAKSNKKLRYAPALLIGIYLISFAGCFGVQSEEAFENEKAKTNYKGFDRSEWATTVATFPTPIPHMK